MAGTSHVASTYASRIIEASYRRRVFIAYGGLPYCVRAGTIFSMSFVDWPSLGYSLAGADVDPAFALRDPKIITEKEAIELAMGQKNTEIETQED